MKMIKISEGKRNYLFHFSIFLKFIFLVACLGGAVLQTWNCIDRYLSYETGAQVNVRRFSPALYPEITACARPSLNETVFTGHNFDLHGPWNLGENYLEILYKLLEPTRAIGNLQTYVTYINGTVVNEDINITDTIAWDSKWTHGIKFVNFQ